jgi:hypothetical protein
MVFALSQTLHRVRKLSRTGRSSGRSSIGIWWSERRRRSFLWKRAQLGQHFGHWRRAEIILRRGSHVISPNQFRERVARFSSSCPTPASG